jgi:hypothetical protein
VENNVAYVRESAELRQGAKALVDRAVEMARGAARQREGRDANRTRRAEGGSHLSGFFRTIRMVWDDPSGLTRAPDGPEGPSYIFSNIAR